MNEEGLISGLREDQLVTAEEVDSALRESIEQSIGQAAFQQSKVSGWTGNVVARAPGNPPAHARARAAPEPPHAPDARPTRAGGRAEAACGAPKALQVRRCDAAPSTAFARC